RAGPGPRSRPAAGWVASPTTRSGRGLSSAAGRAPSAHAMTLRRRALNDGVVQVGAVVQGDEEAPPRPREDHGDARVLDEGEPARCRLEGRGQIAVDDAAVDDDRNRLAAVLRRDLADGAGHARPQRVVSLGAGHEVPAPGAGEREPLGVARLGPAAELNALPPAPAPL